VERSDTHRLGRDASPNWPYPSFHRSGKVMGFASLYPSYELDYVIGHDGVVLMTASEIGD
jgi:hypothetical protein